VEIGYNPHKPGRGSHYPLLCVVGSSSTGGGIGFAQEKIMA